jgi:hypothetical protein
MNENSGRVFAHCGDHITVPELTAESRQSGRMHRQPKGATGGVAIQDANSSGMPPTNGGITGKNSA